jgi:hypothetical protein
MTGKAGEYRWVWVVSLLLLAIGSLPIITGYAIQTPGQRFTGAIYDQQDYAVHLAAMHYGEQGGWGYQMRFTSETQPVTFLKTFYVILGHFGGWLQIPAAGLYQAARLGFGLLACLSIYRLMTRVFPSIKQRRLAFLLTMLGAGMGWFQVFSGLVSAQVAPVDLWLSDAYPLFSIDLFPHFSATIAALAIAITAFLDQTVRPRWRNIAVIAACAILVQIVNPIAFILADLAMAGILVFFFWRNHRVDIPLALGLGLIAVIQIPLALYSFFLLTRDPVWSIFTAQNATPSPAPFHYLFGFGLFWPFAIWGAVSAFRTRSDTGWAAIWVIGAFGLAYLPVAIQRRFLLAITLPLAILATPNLLRFSGWLRARLRLGANTGAYLVIGLASISTFLLIGILTLNVLKRTSPQFEPTKLVQAVDWLGKNGASEDVVLASEPTSLLVAIRTPLRLYSGHTMETLHYLEKVQALQRFSRAEQPSGWLGSQGITWVVFGPHELDWQVAATDPSGMEIAYRNDLVRIYQVLRP